MTPPPPRTWCSPRRTARRTARLREEGRRGTGPWRPGCPCRAAPPRCGAGGRRRTRAGGRGTRGSRRRARAPSRATGRSRRARRGRGRTVSWCEGSCLGFVQTVAAGQVGPLRSVPYPPWRGTRRHRLRITWSEGSPRGFGGLGAAGAPELRDVTRSARLGQQVALVEVAAELTGDVALLPVLHTFG